MKNFLDADLDVSEIVIALKIPAGHGTAVHKNRGSHGFAIFTGGKRKYCFKEKKIPIGKLEIIYMPKFSDYHVETSENGECYAINFDFPEDYFFEPFSFIPKNPAVFLDSFRNAEKTWRTKSDGYIYKCKAELYSVLFGMRSERAAGYLPASKFGIITPAVKLIHEKYTSGNLSVSELAELCGVSPEYFRLLFKKSFGISPVKYINNLKISRAKELLASGMYSVATAAEMSGFPDMSYFSREFKKITGMPPSRFVTE